MRKSLLLAAVAGLVTCCGFTTAINAATVKIVVGEDGECIVQDSAGNTFMTIRNLGAHGGNVSVQARKRAEAATVAVDSCFTVTAKGFACCATGSVEGEAGEDDDEGGCDECDGCEDDEGDDDEGSGERLHVAINQVSPEMFRLSVSFNEFQADVMARIIGQVLLIFDKEELELVVEEIFGSEFARSALFDLVQKFQACLDGTPNAGILNRIGQVALGTVSADGSPAPLEADYVCESESCKIQITCGGDVGAGSETVSLRKGTSVSPACAGGNPDVEILGGSVSVFVTG